MNLFFSFTCVRLDFGRVGFVLVWYGSNFFGDAGSWWRHFPLAQWLFWTPLGSSFPFTLGMNVMQGLVCLVSTLMLICSEAVRISCQFHDDTTVVAVAMVTEYFQTNIPKTSPFRWPNCVSWSIGGLFQQTKTFSLGMQSIFCNVTIMCYVNWT